MNSTEFSTRIVGAEMIFVSFVGFLINFFMLFHFLTLEKTSFHLLCVSKTLSNSLILLVYLVYTGPVHLLYTQIGSIELNILLHHFAMYGLMLQGPITQLIITINRVLVLWFLPLQIPKSSRYLTTVIIILTWIFVGWQSTLFGLPEDCKSPFAFFEHTFYTTASCSTTMFWIKNYVVFSLAAVTNFLNLMMAVKLVVVSRTQKSISSVAYQRRRKRSIKFFFQSCIQDWISAVDAANNAASTKYCENQSCIMLISMSVDVVVFGVDGFVLYWFNYKHLKIQPAGVNLNVVSAKRLN